MTTWFSRERIQLAATAVVSGAVVAGAILGYQHVRRVERVEHLKRSVPELGDGHEVDKVGLPFWGRNADGDDVNKDTSSLRIMALLRKLRQ